MDTCKVGLCLDAAGVLVIAGTFANVVPWLASAAAFIWYLVQIYESRSGVRARDWLHGVETRMAVLMMLAVSAFVILTIVIVESTK